MDHRDCRLSSGRIGGSPNLGFGLAQYVGRISFRKDYVGRIQCRNDLLCLTRCPLCRKFNQGSGDVFRGRSTVAANALLRGSFELVVWLQTYPPMREFVRVVAVV